MNRWIVPLMAVVLAATIVGCGRESSRVTGFELESGQYLPEIALPAGQFTTVRATLLRDGRPVADEPVVISVTGPGKLLPARPEQEKPSSGSGSGSDQLTVQTSGKGRLEFVYATDKGEKGEGEVLLKNPVGTLRYKTTVVPSNITFEWKLGPSDLGKMIEVRLLSSEGIPLTSTEGYTVQWSGRGIEAVEAQALLDDWFRVRTAERHTVVKATACFLGRPFASDTYSY